MEAFISCEGGAFAIVLAMITFQEYAQRWAFRR